MHSSIMTGDLETWYNALAADIHAASCSTGFAAGNAAHTNALAVGLQHHTMRISPSAHAADAYMLIAYVEGPTIYTHLGNSCLISPPESSTNCL